jgi:hypothetical protein
VDVLQILGWREESEVTITLIKIVGVQSRNKCSLWNVERKELGSQTKNQILFKQIYFQKILKLKIYYAN